MNMTFIIAVLLLLVLIVIAVKVFLLLLPAAIIGFIIWVITGNTAYSIAGFLIVLLISLLKK